MLLYQRKSPVNVAPKILLKVCSKFGPRVLAVKACLSSDEKASKRHRSDVWHRSSDAVEGAFEEAPCARRRAAKTSPCNAGQTGSADGQFPSFAERNNGAKGLGRRK